MAVVETRSPEVSAKTACYRWYHRVASSRSAPGQILEIDLEASEAVLPELSERPGVYPHTATDRERRRSKLLKRTKKRPHHQSQVLMDSSILSSILDSPSLMSNYGVSMNLSGLQNMEAVKEHFRSQSSPLMFSTSCPCNIDSLSSYQSPVKTTKLIAHQSRGSLGSSSSSPSPEGSPEQADSWSRTSRLRKSPKCSTPNATAPNLSVLPSSLQISPQHGTVLACNDLSDADTSPNSNEQKKNSDLAYDNNTVNTASTSLNSSLDSESTSTPKEKNSATDYKKCYSLPPVTGIAQVSGPQEQASTCRRSLLKEFEENLTFKPAMNRNSMKIVARVMRKSKPLEQRLLETRKNSKKSMMERDYTFSPHLNPYSIKLAKDRASRQTEVQTKQSGKPSAGAQNNCTFKPVVSERSQRIAESLQTSFLRRQEIHLEKRKQVDSLQTTSKVILRKKNFLRSSTQPSMLTSPTHTSTSSEPQPTMKQISHPAPLAEESSTAKSPLAVMSTEMAPPGKALTEAPASGRYASGTELAPIKHKKGSISKASEGKMTSSHINIVKTRSKTPVQVCYSKTTGKRIATQTSPTLARGGSTAKPTPGKKVSPTAQKKKLPDNSGLKLQASLNRGKLPPTKQANQQPQPSKLDQVAGSQSQSSPPNVDPLELKDFSKLNSRDKFRRVKMVAERKVKERKIFVLKGGYRLIRRCLRKRGWVELNYHLTTANNNPHITPKLAKKEDSTKKEESKSTDDKGNGHKKAKTGNCDEEDDSEEESDIDSDVDLNLGLSDEEYSDEEEYTMVSRSVRNATPNLVWTMMTEKESSMTSYDKHTLMNHFPKTVGLTTKVGLCNNLRNLRWYGDVDSDYMFPRCYKLACDEDKEVFIDDFRMTAAVSILKTVAGIGISNHSRPPSSLKQSSKEFPLVALRLAIRAVSSIMHSQRHNDIEYPDQGSPLTDIEWDDVVQLFYAIDEGARVCCTPEVINEIKILLNMVEEINPQYHIDGTRNMWIVKPGALSRGRGIMCMTKLEDILNLVAGSNGFIRKANRWVVQKYIEQPLLIFNTKFDIRQWFLVTSWNPLTMWMYKECYLRFSTQPFSLHSLNASIHLCNNSIQRHYSNCPSRSDKLPPHNMWDSATFADHLESIGERGSWDKKIYPGMKKALTHVLLVTQDEMEDKKNCFELYGADFMIDGNLNPWLIEINSCPTMESSTEVTKRLCRQVLEDTIKVIVDRKENKDCSTGQFELAFRQVNGGPRVDAVTYVGTHLFLEGQSMPVRPRPLGMMEPDGNHKYENTVTVVGQGTIPSHMSLAKEDV